MPSLVSQSASTRPVGPAPTMRTSACIEEVFMRRSRLPGDTRNNERDVVLRYGAAAPRIEIAECAVSKSRGLAAVPGGQPPPHPLVVEELTRRISRLGD